jgi:hypothetical protein
MTHYVFFYFGFTNPKGLAAFNDPPKKTASDAIPIYIPSQS